MSSKRKSAAAADGTGRLYCSIIDYIQRTDPELADAINSLCLASMLGPGAGMVGVTFLLPDKATRDKIVAAAEGGPTEQEMALKLIKAHIVPDLLKSGADWKSPKVVGSRLGVKFVVKSVSGDTVVIDGADGAAVTIQPERGFAALSLGSADGEDARERYLAVWKCDGGHPPTSGEHYDPPRRQRGARGGNSVFGTYGSVCGGSADRVTRQYVADKAVRHFVLKMRGDNCCKSGMPYLEYLLGLLKFLQISDPERYAAVLPLLGFEPIASFFILLQPYKRSGPYLVSDEAIAEWGGVSAYHDAVAEYTALLNESVHHNATQEVARLRNGTDGPCVVVTRAVDQLRGRMATDASKLTLQSALLDRYKELHSSNAVGGQGPVLPDATRQITTPEQLLHNDIVRLLCAGAVLQGGCAYGRPGNVFDDEAFDALILTLKCVYPGNDHLREVQQWIARMMTDVAPTLEFGWILRFLQSTAFLHVLASDNQLRPAGQVFNAVRGVIDLDAEALVLLRGVSCTRTDPQGLSRRVARELALAQLTAGQAAK